MKVGSKHGVVAQEDGGECQIHGKPQNDYIMEIELLKDANTFY